MPLFNDEQWNYITTQSWPAQAIQGLLSAARMPGDAYMGKYAGQPVEAVIPDATEFAGTMGILGGVVPRPVNSIGMGGVPLLGQAEKKASELFTFDNPSAYAKKGSRAADYITQKIATAARDMRLNSKSTHAGKGLQGPATAYTKKPEKIRMDVLRGIQGAWDEFPYPSSEKYQNLMKLVRENGWQGDKNPILIQINHKGVPYITEGNHRVAVARDLGLQSVPAQIEWKNGAEMVSKLTPDEVIKWIAENGS